jgi:hypothetical protein
MADSPPSRPKLGDILTQLQLVEDEQVQAALRHQKKTGMLFGESLLSLGYIAEDDLGWALSNQLGFPFVAVTPEMADPALLLRFTPEFLRKNRVLPLVSTDSSLSVVLSDPTDEGTIARLERMSGCELQIAVGTPSAITRALDEAMGDREEEPAAGIVTSVRPASLSSPELAQLLDRAFSHRACQVHLDPEGRKIKVRFRRADGDLVDGGWYEKASLRALVDGLKAWLGEGDTRTPGIHRWTPDTAAGAPELPFTALALEGEEGPSLTLLLEGTEPSLPPAGGPSPVEWERLETLVHLRTGLLVMVAPTQRGRQSLVAGVLSRIEKNDRRACLLDVGPATLGGHLFRLAAPVTEETVSLLSRSAGVDILAGAFGDLTGLPSLLEAAHRDRLVVAAFPGNSALGFLVRALEAGSSSVLLAESLLAVTAALRLPPSPEEEESRTLGEVLFCDAPLRRALQDGGHPGDLREAARAQNFSEMATRAPGDLPATLRAELDRHRYLEEAA